MVKVTVPIRIDLGGGLSDIPVFKKTAGTFITSLGLDLYQNKKKLEIKIILEKSFRNKVIYNRQEIFLLDRQHKPNLLVKLFQILQSKFFKKENLRLKIINPLPSQTGLGVSSALTTGILAAFLALKNKKITPNIIKIAHQLETVEFGVEGGIQDYICAYFGNLNKINFVNLKNIGSRKQLGISLNSETEDILNSNMLVLIRKNNRISSSEIVLDEIDNFNNQPELVTELNKIIEANKRIYDLLSNDNFDLTKLSSEINKSWQSQKKFSKKIVDRQKSVIEKRLIGNILALRGPGCGANSYFVILNPANKKMAFEVISSLENYATYSAKINKSGLRIKF